MTDEITISTVEERLGVTLPDAILTAMEEFRGCEQLLSPCYLVRPRTLLVENLRTRLSPGDWQPPADVLLVAHDGSERTSFVSLNEPNRVRTWSVETDAVDEKWDELSVVVRELASRKRDEAATAPCQLDELVVTHAESDYLSVLEPIFLGTLRDTISNLDGFEMREYREGRNPFTGEAIRFESPGNVVCSGGGPDEGEGLGEDVLVRCVHGALRIPGRSKVSRSIADTLAGAFGANVVDANSGLIYGVDPS